MFLAARAAFPPGAVPAATLLGAPYDGTASFRRGARLAPAAIRRASESIESYSPVLDRDLAEVPLLDRGDLRVEHLSPQAMVAAVEEAASGMDGLAVLLGGDHAVTVGAVRAAAARHADLHVLVLDGHLDLRETYEGSAWSHACTTRRVMDVVGGPRVAVLGARSGSREEFAAAEGLAAVERSFRLGHDLWSRLEGYPLYLSVDIDAVDPAHAPGTGNPEPGGPSAEDLLDLVRVLAPLRVVGLDIVEVSPPYDPSGRTAVLAALFVREAVLTWTVRGDASVPYLSQT